MAIKYSEFEETPFGKMPKEIKSNRTVQSVMRRLSRGNGVEIPAARKEYAALRKLANKRIKRAQQAGDLLTEELFPETRTIGKEDVGNLAKALVDVKKFLKAERSTAKGRKAIAARKVAKLQALGFESVTVDNEKLFSDFMEMWRVKYQMETAQGRKLTMDSDFAAEIFDKISERFTPKTNKSSMSRMFNDYLRAIGQEHLIVKKKAAKRKK